MAKPSAITLLWTYNKCVVSSSIKVLTIMQFVGIHPGGLGFGSQRNPGKFRAVDPEGLDPDPAIERKKNTAGSYHERKRGSGTYLKKSE